MWNEMLDIHVGGGNYQAASLARAMLLSKETESRLKRAADKQQKPSAAQYSGSSNYYQKSCN